MHPVLESVLAAIEAQVEGMAPEDLERHRPGKWSAAGILEHLSITFDGTSRNLRKVLQTGARPTAPASLRQRIGILRVIELGWFPTGVQAPEPTRPKGVSGSEALAAIRQHLPAMDAAMQECAARFGTRGAIAVHHILGPLSLRQWRRFHLVHTRHHMEQIKGLRLEA
jgi:hypothetical protein